MSIYNNIFYHQPDDCGYSAFDYAVMEAKELILKEKTTCGLEIDNRIWLAIKDDPEIKKIIDNENE